MTVYVSSSLAFDVFSISEYKSIELAVIDTKKLITEDVIQGVLSVWVVESDGQEYSIRDQFIHELE